MEWVLKMLGAMLLEERKKDGFSAFSLLPVICANFLWSDKLYGYINRLVDCYLDFWNPFVCFWIAP